jgi:hypothetical protein
MRHAELQDGHRAKNSTVIYAARSGAVALGARRMPRDCATVLDSPGCTFGSVRRAVVFPAKPSQSLIAAKHVNRRRESSLSSRVRSPGTSGETGCDHRRA